MNKTEFRKLPAEEVRAIMQEVFEDPDGELETMSKKDMLVVASANWSVLEDYFDNPPEIVEEPEPVEESSPPHLDLYTFKPSEDKETRNPSESPNLDLGYG